MCKVSVIIPTYNREHLVTRAIESVLNQTMESLEVLVCDDCSKDNTIDVVSKIYDPRVKLLSSTSNQGVAAVRNLGIKNSSGEWIAFLDDDDEWLSTKLEKQLAFIKKEKCKACCCSGYIFIPGKGKTGVFDSWDKARIKFCDLLRYNMIYNSTVLLNKSLLNECDKIPNVVCEDYATWLRIATQTDFAYLREPLILYRQDYVNSLTGTIKMNGYQQRREIWADFLKWAQDKKIDSFYINLGHMVYEKALWSIKRKKVTDFVKGLIGLRVRY
jgi:teichuronic acid biosynthesis glycosyltransferase TuaG